MENEKMKVTLCNETSFEYKKHTYYLDKYLTRNLLSLLEILILNYGTQVSSDYIINIMWQENTNPKSSLKYHIFKLRKYLREIPGLENIDFIGTTKLGYEFNPNIECEVDTFILNNCYGCIQMEKSLDLNNFEDALTIVEVYKGYLKCDCDYLWFLQTKAYYHTIYLKTINKLCNYLLQVNENEKVIEIASKAVEIDPTIELHHIFYIHALMNINEFEKAYDYYQETTKMLSESFDIPTSKDMKELCEYLMNGMKQRNVITIADHFSNKKPVEGALCCESNIFDSIYDLYLRSSSRTKLNYYLFVFDITPKSEIKDLTKKLKKIIQNSLRTGDVFTRVSKYQFIALLPCVNDEIGHIVAQRVTSVMRKKLNNDHISVHYHIESVIKGNEQ